MITTEYKTVTFPEFSQIKDSIALDASFQVGSYHEGRWGQREKTAYIESLLMNMAIQPVIIVDIDRCLSNCIPDTDDHKYFSLWKDAGFNFISVDGNNRSIAMHDFYHDRTRLHAAKRYYTELSDGRIADYTLNPNNYHYSSLPAGLRASIDSKVIQMTIVTRATRPELTDLFLRVNSGVSLNGQEKRNAIISPVASTIRALAQRYESTLGASVIKKTGLTRLSFHETIASWLILYTHQDHPITIDNTALDRAYSTNSAEEHNLLSFSKFAESSLDQLSKHSSLFSTAKMKKYNLHNLFLLLNYLNANNYRIKDYAGFVQWFVSSELRRCNAPEPIFTNQKGHSKCYDELTTDESKTLSARLSALLEDLPSLDESILVDLDSQRIATPRQRYQLWESQNGRCAVTNKVIPLEQIHDSSLWQADHIIPYSKGGKTDLSNLQLICYSAHAEKTAEFNSKSSAA